MDFTTTRTQPSLSDEIRKTLFNTFTTVGVMVAITALAGYLSIGANLGIGAMLGLFVGALVTLFAIKMFETSPFGLVLLALFSALMGVSMGPMLTRYTAMPNGTELIVMAAGMTALATWGSAAYVISTRKDFSRFGTFLFGALLVLLAASVLSIFVQSSLLRVAISAIGALVFLFYMLYDISNVVSGSERNYISASVSIYLNVLNLFQYLLSLLSLGSNDD